MEKNMQFAIDISDFDADAWDRLKEARKALEKIQGEIIASFTKSDRAKAAYDLSGFGNYGTKYNPNHRIEGSRIVTNIMVDVEDSSSKKSSGPQLYLGEKTINALINGKLLNDDQKKSLLKQIGVDLDSLTETAGA